MAVSFRNKNQAITTITGNSTVTEPTGAASGDALIGYMVFDAASSTAANASHPAGWTLLYSGTQGLFKYSVAYIIRGGSAPGLTWTTAGTSIYREVHVMCLTGAASLTLDSQATATSGNTTTHFPNPPSTTAIASTSMAICGGSNWAGSGPSNFWVAPTGYTLRSDNTSGNDSAIGTKSLAAAGAEDPAAFSGNLSTPSASDYYDGFTLTFTDVVAGLTAAQQVGIFDQQRSGSVIGRVDA